MNILKNLPPKEKEQAIFLSKTLFLAIMISCFGIKCAFANKVRENAKNKPEIINVDNKKYQVITKILSNNEKIKCYHIDSKESTDLYIVCRNIQTGVIYKGIDAMKYVEVSMD